MIPEVDLPPALFGGSPAFPDGLPLARPRFPDAPALGARLAGIVESGVLTNGPVVKELEARAAAFLGVRHCVAVSSCTAGLMLVMRAANLEGEVVLPSFTFAATAHAAAWNGLSPTFADVRPDTLTLDPRSASAMIGTRTAAILATHLYGSPCEIEELSEIAAFHGIRLFFDAAHAFGAVRRGHRVGAFGDAEVFSLSPTKPLVAAEGGLIATNDDLLAERCRVGRDYGNPGDYDCLFVGLNARMSELHAAVALASFEDLEERLGERRHLADRYAVALAEEPGIAVVQPSPGDQSTHKDLTITVDGDRFGVRARELAEALVIEGVETRRYYSPPVHAMRAYRLATVRGDLPVTNRVADEVVSLPLWSGMSDEVVDGVGRTIRRLGSAFRSGRPRAGADRAER